MTWRIYVATILFFIKNNKVQLIVGKVELPPVEKYDFSMISIWFDGIATKQSHAVMTTQLGAVLKIKKLPKIQ